MSRKQSSNHPLMPQTVIAATLSEIEGTCMIRIEPWINLELVSRSCTRQSRWRRQALPSSQGPLVIIRPVLRPRRDQAASVGPFHFVIPSCRCFQPMLHQLEFRMTGQLKIDDTEFMRIAIEASKKGDWP